MVHRDIKPANILLEEGVERVAITDFGLARAVDDASLTRTGIIAGTPQYMSPEQSRGESVDQRSDLFSLGSVMYAMCAGRPPFRSETTYGVIQRINNDQPTPIREINPDVPDWLATIIDKLMSKRAEGRYESAEEVSDLLEQCLAHVQQPSATPLPASCEAGPHSNAFFSSSRRKFWSIAVMMTFGFGLLCLFLWQGTDPPDITGKWYGDGWGEVELEHQSLGHYKGVYSDTFGDQQGTIELEWSRIERRFNGNWGEGKDRTGKISLRHTDDGIFGAWTTSQKSEINPSQPELADLQWSRRQAAKASGFRDPFDGVEKPLEDFHANRRPSNEEAKKPDSQQEAVAASKFSTVWVWDDWPKWKLVFEGGKTWIEGKRSTWTETGRSEECIYLRDDERNMRGMLYGDSYFYREVPDETWTMVTGSWVRDKRQTSATCGGFRNGLGVGRLAEMETRVQRRQHLDGRQTIYLD